MNLPDSFKSWLQSKNHSPSTIRNYLVDINKFLQSSNLDKLDELSDSQLEAHISSISSDPNFSRQISSLNKFFQFAVNQNLITQNPLKKILKRLNPDPKTPSTKTSNVLEAYQTYLTKKKMTQVTIKNYINDIQQFIDWSENEPK